MHWEYEINKHSRATQAGNTALRVQGIHLGTDQWLQDAGEGLQGYRSDPVFLDGPPRGHTEEGRAKSLEVL